jgi:hypothetical protein
VGFAALSDHDDGVHSEEQRSEAEGNEEDIAANQ